MRLALLLVVAALLAPTAAAHLQGARPVQQVVEVNRLVQLEPVGLMLRADLFLASDPLRHSLRYTFDPPRGLFAVEYRVDQSEPSSRFVTELRFSRLIEYRDLNLDGRYQPERDTPVKVWAFDHYRWNATAPRDVQVADVTASSVVWEGNLTGAPRLRIEAVIAGREFTDEGALVRPQDVALYIDAYNIPPRAVGSLYALEGELRHSPEHAVALHHVGDSPTAALVSAQRQRSMFVWGGEALVDGREQPVTATLGEAREEAEDGLTARPFALNLPGASDRVHLVAVLAVEYTSVNKRTPLGAEWLVAALGAAALVARGRLSRSAR